MAKDKLTFNNGNGSDTIKWVVVIMIGMLTAAASIGWKALDKKADKEIVEIRLQHMNEKLDQILTYFKRNDG